MPAKQDYNYFDSNTGVLDRSIFSDEEIYQDELKKIFARAWNFICHESQIAKGGHYFMNFIGEDEVIAVRDHKGEVHVLLNSCPHRGNTVCRAEQGSTNSFFCSYHGWSFALDGSLVGMPGEEKFYRDQVDRDAWGLSAARVEIYHGFVFASLDPEAPPLEEYLGWVGKLGIDFIASQGEVEFLDGVVKNRIQCNWKLAVDNLFDWYHPKVSHGSAIKVLGANPDDTIAPDQQLVILGEYGHGISGPGISEADFDESELRLNNGGKNQTWYDPQVSARLKADATELLGPVGKRAFGHPNVFPNLWVSIGTNQVCLRIPRGPFETELWWFTYQTKEMPESERAAKLYMANHFFGPGGILEQDDGENWSHSTRAAKGVFARTQPVFLTMGVGADKVQQDASGQAGIETVINEHGQRWTYQSWQDWMRSDNWQELAANHSTPPQEAV